MVPELRMSLAGPIVSQRRFYPWSFVSYNVRVLLIRINSEAAMRAINNSRFKGEDSAFKIYSNSAGVFMRMVKNSFIEKTNVEGTHWNCLIEAIPMCTYNNTHRGNSNVYLQHMLLKLRKKTIWKFTFSKYHVQLSLPPISIEIPVTLLLHDSYIYKFEFINYLFVNLLVAWM